MRLFRLNRKLTPLFEDIGLALIKRLGSDGQCDPSHQTLADDLRCSAKSVERALNALQSCGLVTWVRRLVRDGWRTAQTSNAYVLTIGEEPPPTPVPACDRQAVRETLQEAFNLLPAPPQEVADAKKALAEIAARRENALFKTRSPGVGSAVATPAPAWGTVSSHIGQVRGVIEGRLLTRSAVRPRATLPAT